MQSGRRCRRDGKALRSMGRPKVKDKVVRTYDGHSGETYIGTTNSFYKKWNAVVAYVADPNDVVFGNDPGRINIYSHSKKRWDTGIPGPSQPLLTFRASSTGLSGDWR